MHEDQCFYNNFWPSMSGTGPWDASTTDIVGLLCLFSLFPLLKLCQAVLSLAIFSDGILILQPQSRKSTTRCCSGALFYVSDD